jgi:hypothetical protein
MTATIFIISVMVMSFLLEKDHGDKDVALTPAWYQHQFRRIFRMNTYTYTTVDSRVFVIRNGIGQGYIDETPNSYVMVIHGFDSTFNSMKPKSLDDVKKLFNVIQSSLNPHFGRDLARDVANLPVSKNYSKLTSFEKACNERSSSRPEACLGKSL